MLESTLQARLQAALTQLNRIIIGKESTINLAMACLLARGHLLLEDLPGAGKTTLAKAFSATLDLSFRRIQFTSDLLPADVVGFSTLDGGKLQFHEGPVFTELLLADEINRASPKSQSALLEAMEERQVTIEHETRPLPDPFFVIATQNPLEQVGTYALPESQLDRFLMRLSLGYPSAKQEVQILQGDPRAQMLESAKPCLSRKDVIVLRQLTSKITVSAALATYAQHLLAYTRDPTHFRQGLSTRAGLGLISASRAYALLLGQRAVLPEHVQAVFPAVAWHRLAMIEDNQPAQKQAIDRIITQVAVPL